MIKSYIRESLSPGKVKRINAQETRVSIERGALTLGVNMTVSSRCGNNQKLIAEYKLMFNNKSYFHLLKWLKIKYS